MAASERTGSETSACSHADNSVATPSAINFMAMHGRGLICLALTPDRIERLGRHRTHHRIRFLRQLPARFSRSHRYGDHNPLRLQSA